VTLHQVAVIDPATAHAELMHATGSTTTAALCRCARSLAIVLAAMHAPRARHHQYQGFR
jgi:hypothetical protein